MKKLTTLFAALLYSTAAFSQAGGVLTGPKQPGQVIGTPAPDSASAGNVGEYFASLGGTSGAPISLTTVTATNLASVNLTPGDWRVSCTIYFVPAATTTMTFLIASLGTTNTAVNNAVAGQFAQVSPNGANGGNVVTVSIPPYRVTPSSYSPYYCNGYAAFGTSTLAMWGVMTAVRTR